MELLVIEKAIGSLGFWTLKHAQLQLRLDFHGTRYDRPLAIRLVVYKYREESVGLADSLP